MGGCMGVAVPAPVATSGESSGRDPAPPDRAGGASRGPLPPRCRGRWTPPPPNRARAPSRMPSQPRCRGRSTMPINPNAEIEITAFRWVPEFAQGVVRDLRARWALEEAGLDYKVQLLDQKRPPEYLRE